MNAQLTQESVQDIAAALIVRHLRLHPILRNYGNGMMMLPRFFKSQIREEKSLGLPPQELHCCQYKILKHSLPGLCREALDALQ